MSDNKAERKSVNLNADAPVDYEFERLIKDFLKKVQKDGILEEVKRRRYYIKPSEVKRLAKKESARKK